MQCRNEAQGRALKLAWSSRYVPKSYTCLREGLTWNRLGADASAGLTVAIIAFPLAMALGISSIPVDVAQQLRETHPWLTPPAIGLFTAAVAGFLISALGGSRVQIGGPTASFIPIVFGVAGQFGFEGLALATIMAGLILILMGAFHFGALIKFIPYPVTTGFTSGIAVTIFVLQIKDFLGLRILDEQGRMQSLPTYFVPKLQVLAAHVHNTNWHAFSVGAVSLAGLLLLRRIAPRLPGAIIIIAIASAAVYFSGWGTPAGSANLPLVETIGSRFGGVPNSLPSPRVPGLDVELVLALLPSALTIAMLCAIESLLSAVVADGMTGSRHRADQELVAQGIANIGSALFFGLPAVGAVARTVTNIKAGASTPMAGMIHAASIVVFMLVLAPLAKLIPLPTLAAVLFMVAFSISQVDQFRALLRAPRHDMLVLLTSFGLTVFTDITLGLGFGMVLASLLFMKRMADISNIAGLRLAVESGQDPAPLDPKDPGAVDRTRIPPGVEIYEINGPFFFGVADRLKDVLASMNQKPKVFILRMRYVPHIDATGLHALEDFLNKCRRNGTRLLLGGVHAQPMFEFARAGFDDKVGLENIFENLPDALARARELLGLEASVQERDARVSGQESVLPDSVGQQPVGQQPVGQQPVGPELVASARDSTPSVNERVPERASQPVPEQASELVLDQPTSHQAGAELAGFASTGSGAGGSGEQQWRATAHDLDRRTRLQELEAAARAQRERALGGGQQDTNEWTWL
ncbi:MAG: SulP family inorganic anion transporter [Planctomycetota bacterium]|nr:SulP family inorganic anion transporter [Planctomycetota bacterium]